MSELERKLFLGGRLGRLRREMGLTQTRMAADLGVSPSYLNHLERNQRPLTAQILLKLAQAYDLDLRGFSAEADAGNVADVQEVLADPMFRSIQISRHEISELLEHAPGVAEALVRLYRGYVDRRRQDDARGAQEAEGEDEAHPNSWVRDYIQAHQNHFPELDALGEALHEELDSLGPPFEQAAARRLAERHNIAVRIMSTEVMPEWLRRYDPHRRQLRLVETLGASGRMFAIAYMLAWLEQADTLNGMVAAAASPNLATQRMLKIALTNYLAAAMLMPYAVFQGAAEALSYDIGILAARFGVSFEQACHRLTTLSRPSAKGVPFFMLRVDAAGNISKRFTSIAFPFARFGGACPRWNIHAAFRTPGAIVTQVIETPDKARYFTLARTIDRVARPYGEEGGGDLAVGMGCEIKYASRLVYAHGRDLSEAVEVGPTCRLCERVACRERAQPPVNRTLEVNDLIKSAAPFWFSKLEG